MPGTFFQRALGAYQIAHHLRTFGYTCQVIEFSQFFTSEELIKAIEKFITKETLGVGVSTTWFDKTVNKDPIRQALSFKPGLPDTIVETLQYIKSNYPSLKLIAGGAVTKAYRNNPLFDYVIFSYAEDKMLELANSLSGKRKFEKFNIENLQHRFLDQDIILNNESLPIEVARGCIFKCAFCSFPLNGKKKFDYIRNPKYVVEEMEYNYNKFDITNYLFTDDTLNDTTMKIRSLHQHITTLPFKINFTSYLRLDLLYKHREQIHLLKEMGLKAAAFGIETFHPIAGKAVGKNMSADKTKKFLDDLHNIYWGEDIRIHCHMISGLPDEPIESIKQSMDWLHNRPFSSLYGTFSMHEPSEDKSKISMNPQQYGYWVDEMGKWHNRVTNQYETERLYAKHFALMVRRKVYYDSFSLIGAFKHYSYEKAMKVTWKDVVENSEEIYNQKIQFINEYKTRLFAL